MIKLLIQSDDYGITPAVSAGIREGIKNGLIKNTGMFVNMPCSYQAAQDIKDMTVCLGIDINYVCGSPVSDVSLVPHLVDENGNFLKSTEILKKSKIVSSDKLGFIHTFEIDPFPYDEVYLEAENQIKRFIEIMGRLPEYINAHSLCTPNTHKAAKELAKKYGIMQSYEFMSHNPSVPKTLDATKGVSIQDQLNTDVTGILLKQLNELEDDKTYYFISHCGYMDAELFKESTLTLRRMRDLEALLDKNIKDFINQKNIKLITYKDLEK